MLAPPEALAPLELRCTADGVRSWCVALDGAPWSPEELLSVLGDDERARAAAYPDARRGERFALGRGVLRHLLSAVTDVAPRSLRFRAGRDGKPHFGGALARSGLQFNLSHSLNFVVVAVCRGQRVGVDAAWVGGSAPIAGVAGRYFSAPERAVLDGVDERERRRRFFRVWVRKEAYLKGRGEGISARIYDTDFSAPLGERTGEPAGVSVRWEGWEVHDLAGLPSTHIASVAVERGSP